MSNPLQLIKKCYKTTFENGETRSFTSGLPLDQLITLNVGDLRETPMGDFCEIVSIVVDKALKME